MIFLSAPAKNGRIKKARAVLETPSSVSDTVLRELPLKIVYFSTSLKINARVADRSPQ